MNNFPGIDADPNPIMLAEAISQTLDNKDKFPEIAEEGRSYIEKYHSCISSAGKFIELWGGI
jgi:hypothetical protein